MNNKRKSITFTYEGTAYTLEFTADSLKKMERNGYDFSGEAIKILSLPEETFCGAFIANHPEVPRSKRIEIFHELMEADNDGNDLFDVLTDMMVEAVDEIHYHSGNVRWEVKK